MRLKPGLRQRHGEKVVKDIRRAPRKQYPAEEKIRNARRFCRTRRRSLSVSKSQKAHLFTSLARWMWKPLMVGSEYLWPGRFHERLHISTRQYARIVHDWVASIGLDTSAYGTHSMRRTNVTRTYKKTCNLRAV